MKLLSCLLIIVGFVACNKTVNSANANFSSKLELDTLKDNTIYFLDSISKEDFFALQENKKIFIKCTDENVFNDLNVNRNDSVLSFQLQKGTIKNLINDSKSDKRYCYKASLDDINQWLVCSYCGDEHSYSIYVDKNTGKETNAVSYPIFSPNKKYFVCIKMNWTGYHIIQLFKVEEDKQISKLWYKLLTDWGISDARWKDDATLLLKKESISETEDNGIQTQISYLKFPLDI